MVSSYAKLLLLAAGAATSSHAASLIDTLKANGATQFALHLQADPATLAFFLSPAVKTVFAPIDGYAGNHTRLVRRQTNSDDYQSSALIEELSMVQQVMKRGVSSSSPSKNTTVLHPIHTNLQQRTDGNQSVVPELGEDSKSAPYKIKARQNWGSDAPPAGAWSSAPAGAWSSTPEGGSHPDYSTSPTSSVWVKPTPEPYKTSDVPEHSTTPSSKYSPVESSHVSYTQSHSSHEEPIPTGVVPNPPVKLSSGLGDRVKVLKADIPYDGGLIQITEALFTVPISVSQTLKATNLTGFLNLVNQANLTASLDARSKITIFAPSNAALAAFAASSSNPVTLVNSHVVPNFVGFSPLLKNGLKLQTLAGTTITVTRKNGDIYINDAKIVFSDVITDNGVIQVIDKVLAPGPVQSNDGSSARNGFTMMSVLAAIGLLLVAR